MYIKDKCHTFENEKRPGFDEIVCLIPHSFESTVVS